MLHNRKIVKLTALLLLTAACSGALISGFRAPAIPLITTEPFVENWMMASDLTSDVVRYWPGDERDMTGFIRIDGTAYRFLGLNPRVAPDTPVQLEQFTGLDIAPGSCDIASFSDTGSGLSVADCQYYCQSYDNCKAFVMSRESPVECYLKSCVAPIQAADRNSFVSIPEAIEYDSMNVAPGSCDISHQSASLADCKRLCYLNDNCKAYVRNSDGECYLKSCAEPVVPDKGTTSYVLKPTVSPRTDTPKPLTQISYTVYPTRTVFELELSGVVHVTLTFLATMFASDLDRLSRPVSYISVQVSSLDGVSHSVQTYFDVSGQHTTNVHSEKVIWSSWKKLPSGVSGLKMGNVLQPVLKHTGDRFGINWGYVHLATAAQNAQFSVDTTYAVQSAFIKSGVLPPISTKMPVEVGDGVPVMAIAIDLGSVSPSSPAEALYAFAYDDVKSAYFFGQEQVAYWARDGATIQDMIQQALSEYPDMVKMSKQHDSDLIDELTKIGGDKYATLGALAYRQTYAAIKLTWNADKKAPDAFLKEISTNGDMSTMDVIYPGSPVFIYTNPTILKLLLDPVLRYANNETWIKFTNPFSPHQLGTFPIGNDTTEAQEPMPMENTGNMFLMLLAILQRDPSMKSWLYPHYWPMLTWWADYLTQTLPFPSEQLCTDDFTGALKNNSNLAAKGIVALAAFSEICEMVTPGAPKCQAWHDASVKFADTWLKASWETSPSPHSRMAFDMPNTWSTKYNMVWQKLLGLNTWPFKAETLEAEVQWYLQNMHKYGLPLDPRHDYAKLDWAIWAATLASNDDDFHAIFDPLYQWADETSTRCPLSDLFYTTNGEAVWNPSFVARPVVGGLFAKALLN